MLRLQKLKKRERERKKEGDGEGGGGGGGGGGAGGERRLGTNASQLNKILKGLGKHPSRA